MVAVEAVDVAVIGVAVVKAGLGSGMGGEVVAVVAIAGAGAGGWQHRTLLLVAADDDGHEGDNQPGDEAGEVEHGQSRRTGVNCNSQGALDSVTVSSAWQS